MSAATLECPAAQEESEVLLALSALRSSGDAMAELLDGVFDDLEMLGTEVDVRARLLDDARRHAAEQATELNVVRHAEALATAELHAVRREIEMAREQVQLLPQENSELRNHLHALELERCGLESELEALRVRTAELADHLTEVKRESAEERAEWSGELKQLRRTLERQAELLADRLAATHAFERPAASPAIVAQGVKTTQETPVAPAPSAAPVAKDAVLGSVMAQFEMLQKDRQRRRTQ